MSKNIGTYKTISFPRILFALIHSRGLSARSCILVACSLMIFLEKLFLRRLSVGSSSHSMKLPSSNEVAGTSKMFRNHATKSCHSLFPDNTTTPSRSATKRWRTRSTTTERPSPWSAGKGWSRITGQWLDHSSRSKLFLIRLRPLVPIRSLLIVMPTSGLNFQFLVQFGLLSRNQSTSIILALSGNWLA